MQGETWVGFGKAECKLVFFILEFMKEEKSKTNQIITEEHNRLEKEDL